MRKIYREDDLLTVEIVAEAVANVSVTPTVKIRMSWIRILVPRLFLDLILVFRTGHWWVSPGTSASSSACVCACVFVHACS